MKKTKLIKSIQELKKEDINLKDIKKILKPKKRTLSEVQYIYFHYNESGEIIYIGKTNNMSNRLYLHKDKSKWFNEIFKITYAKTNSSKVFDYENLYIKKYKPKYNNIFKDNFKCDLEELNFIDYKYTKGKNKKISELLDLIEEELKKGNEKINIRKRVSNHYKEALSVHTEKSIKKRYKNKFFELSDKYNYKYITRGKLGWSFIKNN